MEFFKKINDLLGEGCTLSINVAKKGDTLIVGVLPGNPLVKDAAAKNLSPLNVSGTPDELDEGFLAAIEAPISRTTGLLVDMASFEKGEADAKAKSAMIAKQKEEKQKKEAEFKGYLSLAQENCNADKFKDAKTCLDKARAVCDGSDSQNKQIRDMESNINQKSGEGSIFGGVVDKSDGKNVVFKASKTKPAPAPKSDDEDSESEDEADE
ncbi:PRTRC system protein E [Bacteroides acidifaciens]|jgi:PRTRC genetic system protein E|uniref:PRTRC system protein E n=1 Tax=Bacteroides acidifaciens TaxID=85831 RepID=UPI0025704D07|nr:PRTRC system protein E [Bacteroides acidifaciens]